VDSVHGFRVETGLPLPDHKVAAKARREWPEPGACPNVRRAGEGP
jgi:hypothetical protein